MKKLTACLLIIICCSAFPRRHHLKGTWIFKGGIYNGKKEGAPTDYTLQRKYQANKFDAYLLEKGQKPQKYQSGNYQLKKIPVPKPKPIARNHQKLPVN
jgi:hypothetical protein